MLSAITALNNLILQLKSILLYTLDSQIVNICLDVCSENGISLMKRSELAPFMVDLKTENHNLIIYDCSSSPDECLNWVKIIKSLKPKTNLIVISGNVDKKEGGKLYEAGILHLEEKPVTVEIMQKLLVASVSNDNQLIQ